MSDETNYEHDYEKAVWPEKNGMVPTSITGTDLNATFDDEMKAVAEWRERILLALQGIDISLEKLCGTGQSDSDKNLAELIEARGKLDE